ncbi:MAG TPA: transcriptional regulator, partial [Verrucomicrobiae bacterium]|nr:transcriptional regulator [Verrucomicrobiae bacterium]
MTEKKKIEKKAHGQTKPAMSAMVAAILGQSATPAKKKNGKVKVKPEWQKYYARLMELRDQ